MNHLPNLTGSSNQAAQKRFQNTLEKVPKYVCYIILFNLVISSWKIYHLIMLKIFDNPSLHASSTSYGWKRHEQYMNWISGQTFIYPGFIPPWASMVCCRACPRKKEIVQEILTLVKHNSKAQQQPLPTDYHLPWTGKWMKK